MNDGTFKVGEIAQFCGLRSAFKYLNGEECTIVRTAEPHRVIDLRGNSGTRVVYLVEYRGVVFGVPGNKLKKVPGKGPAADHNALQIVPWSSVAWNPHAEPVEA